MNPGLIDFLTQSNPEGTGAAKVTIFGLCVGAAAMATGRFVLAHRTWASGSRIGMDREAFPFPIDSGC